MNRVRLISKRLDADRAGRTDVAAMPKRALTRMFQEPVLLKETKHAATKRRLRRESR